MSNAKTLQINIADLQEKKPTIDLINKTKTPSTRHQHIWKEAQVCYYKSLLFQFMLGAYDHIMYSNILLLSSPEGTVLL